MGERFRIHHAAAFAVPVVGLLLLLLLLPEEALAAELRHGLRVGLGGVAEADPAWLGVTALLLALSLSGSALAWRAALRSCGAPCGRVDAVARYGIGSLANAVLPTKVGGLIRIGLFSRLVRGGNASAIEAEGTNPHGVQTPDHRPTQLGGE